jgi:hypothetical protein
MRKSSDFAQSFLCHWIDKSDMPIRKYLLNFAQNIPNFVRIPMIKCVTVTKIKICPGFMKVDQILKVWSLLARYMCFKIKNMSEKYKI